MVHPVQRHVGAVPRGAASRWTCVLAVTAMGGHDDDDGVSGNSDSGKDGEMVMMVMIPPTARNHL